MSGANHAAGLVQARVLLSAYFQTRVTVEYCSRLLYEMKRQLHTLVIILLAFPVWSPRTGAETGAALHDGIGNAELDARLAFIDSRLALQRPGARTWQYGWTGFYSVGAAAQALLAVDADDSDDQVNYIVGAAKSAGALAQLMIKPSPAVQSSSLFQSMPSRTREERLARLARGEALLRENADRASSRRSWKRHLAGIGANLVGGAIIAAFGDDGDAVSSTLIGIAASELTIWTEPSRAIGDLEDYSTGKWGKQQAGRFNWQVIPAVNRLVVKVSF